MNGCRCWRGLRKAAGLALALLVLGGAGRAGAAEVRPATYSPHGDSFACHMNMGPTGAAAWMRGYHFQVMSVVPDSPAHGRLLPGDRVIGADGVAFGPEAEHRITLGNAIARAEATGDPLALMVVRNGERRTVEIPLPALGAFGPDWPVNCAKSQSILQAAGRALLDAQQPDGRIVTGGNMGTTLGGLLWLASGDPEFEDGARRAAYQAASIDYPGMDLNNWSMGYGATLVAEYYLATGDDSVLEELAGITDELARGQMKSGSWGHKSPGEGYGNLNQPGVVCAIALVLARECGVGVDPVALERALTFFGRFAKTGNIPYGDHMPGDWPDNNGTSASAAVLMHLAGREAEAQAFARAVAMSYWMREHGHTGGFWSMAWGPLAADLAGPEAFRTFMDEQAWHYHLMRTWQGHHVLLPYREALTRFDNATYVQTGGRFTTGGKALVFALPQRRLRILGAPESVFSPRFELASEAMRDLRRDYLARDWAAVDRALAAIDPDELEAAADRRGFAQIEAARALLRASTDRTILEIESNLDEGHGLRARLQLDALQRRLGEAADPRFAGLEERFADGNTDWNVREGRRHWDAWAPFEGISIMTWTHQGRWTQRRLEGFPALRPPVWEPLAPVAARGPQPWRTLLLDRDQTPPDGWEQPGFDDGDWRTGEGMVLAHDLDQGAADRQGGVAARRTFEVADPHGVRLRIRLQTVRPALTRVYLNGVLVLDAVRGQRGGYAMLELDDAALALLRPGENLLAVTSTAQGTGNNRLDVGVDLARYLPQREHLPTDRIATVPATDGDDIDDTLRVHEESDRQREALQARYHEKPLAELLAALEDPVAYIRHLAENALADPGLEGIAPVVELAGHADWKVRSSVCRVITKAARYRRDREAHEAAAALLDAQVPRLIEMLDDPHFWVRVQAATALRTYREAAEAALPALLRRVDDPDDWVRLNAMRTVRTLRPDPEVAVRAAVAVLQHPHSGYPAPRAAFDALRQHAEAAAEEADTLPALLHVLRNPPQGDGRFLLNQVMDKAAGLDPDGEALVPVLIEAAADKTHMSRQRQDPRGHAIAVLGRYGPKAEAALPVLRTILGTEEDSRWHDAARDAMARIRGEAEGD